MTWASSTSLASQTAAPRAVINGNLSAEKNVLSLPCQQNASREAGGLAAHLEVCKDADLCLLLPPASPSVARSAGGTACPCLIDLGRVGRSSPAPGPEEVWTCSTCSLTTTPLPLAPYQKALGCRATSLMEKLGLMKKIIKHSVKRQANLDQTAGNLLSSSTEEPCCGKLWSGRRSSKTNRQLPSGVDWPTGRMGESWGSGQAKL